MFRHLFILYFKLHISYNSEFKSSEPLNIKTIGICHTLLKTRCNSLLPVGRHISHICTKLSFEKRQAAVCRFSKELFAYSGTVHWKPSLFDKRFCMANTSIFTSNITFQSNGEKNISAKTNVNLCILICTFRQD
jgi:hypothetical protein